MSPSCPCFSFETASATSPLSTVELFHSGSSSVEDTTYLGMVLNWSANSPSLDGQAAGKPSEVTRPSSRASASRASSSLNLSPSSPRAISKLQPPYLKSSDPPGSSTTPSSETNSVTTILPIVVLLAVAGVRLARTILNQLIDQPNGLTQMTADQLSNTFSALADPTRRAILGRLAEGEATVNELADPFPITVQAVSKHLKVLERAGLITRGRTAQLRPARLHGPALAGAADWLERYRP